MMANSGKAVVHGEPDLLGPEGYALVSTRIDPPEYDLITRKAMPQEKGGWVVFDEILIEGLEFTGWSGMRGSLFVWNQEHRIGFGYVMNVIPSWETPDRRSIGILKQIVKQALKKSEKIKYDLPHHMGYNSCYLLGGRNGKIGVYYKEI